MKRKSSPPPPPIDYDDPNAWAAVIMTEGLWPWTPYRVYLTAGGIRYGANEGWGWSYFTLRQARRAAARHLARHRRHLEKKQARNHRIKESLR